MADAASIPRAICTVASKNYLAHVRTLAASVRAHHPDVPFLLLLCDRIDGRFDPVAESFEVLLGEELPNLPAPAQFFFRYDVLEANTALKPFFFEHAMRSRGIERLLFLDPDAWVTSPLDDAFALLDRTPIALTPHITRPIADRARPSELDILRAGVFNLGFLGLRASEPVRELLAWWKTRLLEHGEMDPDRGVHVDQRWMDLAPAFFPDATVALGPRFNVGYWNLQERGARLRARDREWWLGDERLAFFHFSGLDPGDPEPISRHQDRFRLDGFPELRPLFDGYVSELRRNGWEDIRSWEYAYGRFEGGGVRIPPAARRAYRELGDAARRFGDPFRASAPNGFLAWLTEPVADDRTVDEIALTRLHLAVWRARPDLVREFPRPWLDDHDAFTAWLAAHGAGECGLDPSFLPRTANVAARARAVRARRARRSLARALLRWGAPLEPRLLRTLGKHSATASWARSMKRRLGSETAIPSALASPPPPAGSTVSTVSAPRFPYGVNVCGYVHGEFGVAEMARASARALEAARIPHRVIEAHTGVGRHADPTVTELAPHPRYAVNLIHVNADQVERFRTERGAGFFEGRRNVGVWFWEIDPFPDRWLDSFKPFDELWVASRHVQSLLSRVSPIPVVHVPLPLTLPSAIAPAPARRSELGIEPGTFVFLFHFDFESGFERKNPLGAIAAFRRAFPGQERVALVIKSIDSRVSPEGLAALRAGSAGDARIRLIDEHWDRGALLGLIAACDAYVSLHRAEGLGLGMAEAMALGKPVIATAYSGNLDFMTSTNSFGVGYELVELTRDHGPYAVGGRWAEPDLAHAAESMRMVFRYPDLARARGARAALDLRQLHGPERTGRLMRERLRVLAPDLPLPVVTEGP